MGLKTMNSTGYLFIYRQIWDHPLLAEDPTCRHIMLDLLTQAAWKPTTVDDRGRAVEVGRGQVMTSERRLAKLTGYSYQKVRTAIKKLQTHRIITVNALPNAGPTLVTFCNFDKYQANIDQPEAVDNAPSTHTSTRRQRTKEESKKKESKKKTQEIPSRAARVEPETQLDLVRDTSLVDDFPEEVQAPDKPKRSSTERAIDRWADVAVPLGAAPVEIETDDIKRKVGKIIGRYGWQAWEKGLSEVAQSPWLLGKQPGFNGSYRDPVTLDWVADDRNFSKIVNGGYRGMAKAVTDVPRPKPMQVEGTPGLIAATYAKFGLKAP